jgi:CBS domain-containing protein
MRCSELMKNHVTSVRGNTPVRDAARQMRDRNVGFLPVCNDQGKVEGVITDRDLCCRIVADGKKNDTPVSDCMSTDRLVTVRPDDDLQRVQQQMGQNRVSRVVVCDEDGKLKGVISLSDLAQVVDPSQCAHTLKRVTEREVEGA